MLALKSRQCQQVFGTASITQLPSQCVTDHTEHREKSTQQHLDAPEMVVTRCTRRAWPLTLTAASTASRLSTIHTNEAGWVKSWAMCSPQPCSQH